MKIFCLLKIRHSYFYEGISERTSEIIAELKLNHIAEDRNIIELLTQISINHDFYNRLNNNQKANFDYLFDQASNAKVDTIQDFLETMEASVDEKII